MNDTITFAVGDKVRLKADRRRNVATIDRVKNTAAGEQFLLDYGPDAYWYGARAAELEHVEVLVVKSSELLPADVVRVHGLRVLLNEHILPIHDNGHGPGISCHGKVLNRESITDTFILQFLDGPDPRWTVQGNDLVSWEVER